MPEVRSLYPVPEFGNGDGGNFKPIIRSRIEPPFEIKGPPFAANDDVGIKNYRHRSVGALSILRAFRKSRSQALASSGGK